jgi:predicted branched-subunit amino acid permease
MALFRGAVFLLNVKKLFHGLHVMRKLNFFSSRKQWYSTNTA